jgi:hypothetical protein
MVQHIIWKADSHSACQKNPALFMEPEGLLPCSQKPAIGPYSEPAESSWVHCHYGMARPQVTDGGKASRYGG